MRTAAEIQAEIDDITTALSFIRKGGQSFTITSGSGAGTGRTVTMADYKTLMMQRQELYRELAHIQNGSVRKIRAGW